MDDYRSPRSLPKEALLRFCAPRTPCHTFWVMIKTVLMARDPRGSKKYVFAWGFALGVRWALFTVGKELEDIRTSIDSKAEGVERLIRKKSKLDLLD